MPNIEVDDEVFAYLKANAEPFQDTPNSVLRRQLLGRRGVTPGRVRSNTAGMSPLTRGPAAFGVPEALRQILEVVEIVRRSSRSRIDATIDVARSHNIARETVADKYGRQLGLSTSGFDMLLSEQSLRGLRARLHERFPEQQAEID